MNRHRLLPALAATAGVLAAIGLTTVVLINTTGSCRPGSVLARVDDALTPILLLNAPYGGSASGTVPIENGTQQLTITANDSGGVWGVFERMDWSIRGAEASGGTLSKCTGTYFVSLADRWSSDVLPLFDSSTPAYTNDSAEPTSLPINGTAGPVFFTNGFDATSGAVSTCGKAASFQNATSSRIDVSVSFQSDGVSHIASTTVDVTTHYEYEFPANVGSWAIDNLSAPGGPGGGWAFSYAPCS